MDFYASRTLETVNKLRVQAGCGPLTYDRCLEAAAKDHCSSMARENSVFAQDSGALLKKVKAGGFLLCEKVYEVGGCGLSNVEEAIKHPEAGTYTRGRLLLRKATHMGAAREMKGGKAYWSVMIGIASNKK